MFDTAMITPPAEVIEVRDLLRDIKKLWDAEGFGSDDAISEPLYSRLKSAIEILER